jgi:hypothetical protein
MVSILYVHSVVVESLIYISWKCVFSCWWWWHIVDQDGREPERLPGERVARTKRESKFMGVLSV